MKRENVCFVSGLAVAFGLMLLVAMVVIESLERDRGVALFFVGGALVGFGAWFEAAD